jgi:hypothetical protein
VRFHEPNLHRTSSKGKSARNDRFELVENVSADMVGYREVRDDRFVSAAVRWATRERLPNPVGEPLPRFCPVGREIKRPRESGGLCELKIERSKVTEHSAEHALNIAVDTSRRQERVEHCDVRRHTSFRRRVVPLAPNGNYGLRYRNGDQNRRLWKLS